MLNSLTSLRFFFAFAVFLSHLTFVQTDLKWYNWLKNVVFFEGYVGVGFFFILSGFVLALNYKHKIIDQPHFSYKNFYIARMARIYPLHVLTFAVMIPLVIVQGLFGWDKALLNISLLHTYIPIKDYNFSINNVSWSISTEFFFYLMFPMYVIGLHRYKWLKYVLFIIAIPLLIYFEPFVTGNKDLEKGIYYVNPLVRSLDFIIGILLCDVYQKIKDTKISVAKGTLFEIGALVIFVLFFSFYDEVVRTFRYNIYYWIPMILITLVFALQRGMLSKILQNKPLIYLGEISFGFYMIHMIVIKYGNYFFPEGNDFIKIGAYFILAIMLSIICFEYFEKPLAKKIKTYFSK
ncbi:acyltransferase [Faecalibacter sp. LW9]|uniref:acyltransferase family protein n=1 Tax=Faecalibacter sp. LW9 TaxID=3103144 RepID=UPI002B003B83|nr:acyltransferase [Faecalibacter sp. LW9]